MNTTHLTDLTVERKNQELLLGDVGWLWTHCRAIGMTRKSDSGLLHHDIALFTADLVNKQRQPAGPEDMVHYDAIAANYTAQPEPVAWKFKFNNGVIATVYTAKEAAEIRDHLDSNESETPLFDRTAPATQQPEPMSCTWCCGTGKFADHLCRFCAGKGKGSVFASPRALEAKNQAPENATVSVVRTLAEIANGKCHCEDNTDPRDDCSPGCAARMARDALSTINEVATQALKTIDAKLMGVQGG